MKAADITSEEKRDAIIAGAEDKKANYITALDLRGKTLIADFFIICSGTSNIHIRSIADGVIEALEKQGIRQRRMEGYSEATWILLDYGDAIVHVMAEEQRDFYGLEKLWTGERASVGVAADASDAAADEPLDAEDADVVSA